MGRWQASKEDELTRSVELVEPRWQRIMPRGSAVLQRPGEPGRPPHAALIMINGKQLGARHSSNAAGAPKIPKMDLRGLRNTRLASSLEFDEFSSSAGSIDHNRRFERPGVTLGATWPSMTLAR